MEEQLTPVVAATPPGDRTAEQTDKTQLHATPLKTPFAKIALALSGGGFRAATFSIGTMSYLHHLKYKDPEGRERSLLDNVEFISSASGGSFPAILFSSYRKKGLSFETVYKDILNFMNGETLLEEVLAIMNEDKEWEDEDKSRNFINAFAKIYDRKLFKGETFGVYWGEGLAVEPGQAGDRQEIEVCLNATEFYRGLSFRWQAGSPVSVSPGGTSVDGKTGNQYIYFNKIDKTALETLKQIKLGDIMASSSCFPAGFEPIIYPRDFTYPGKDAVKKGLNSNTLEQAMIITDYNNRPRSLDTSIGLMDGGIDDNQGVYSAMLADKSVYRSAQALGPAYERPEKVTDEDIETYLRPLVRNDQRTLDLQRFVTSFDNKHTVSIAPKLRALRAPTLIVWATDDIYFPVKWAYWLAGAIPGAKPPVELEGARLFFPEERARDFNRLLRDHLLNG